MLRALAAFLQAGLLEARIEQDRQSLPQGHRRGQESLYLVLGQLEATELLDPQGLARPVDETLAQLLVRDQAPDQELDRALSHDRPPLTGRSATHVPEKAAGTRSEGRRGTRPDPRRCGPSGPNRG